MVFPKDAVIVRDRMIGLDVKRLLVVVLVLLQLMLLLLLLLVVLRSEHGRTDGR